VWWLGPDYTFVYDAHHAMMSQSRLKRLSKGSSILDARLGLVMVVLGFMMLLSFYYQASDDLINEAWNAIKVVNVNFRT